MAGLIYHPQAEDEIREAAAWYERERPGYGHLFLQTVENAAAELPRFPQVWRKISGRFRRALVPKFPYGIIYASEGLSIYIVAVMHLKRKPGYWRERLKKRGA